MRARAPINSTTLLSGDGCGFDNRHRSVSSPRTDEFGRRARARSRRPHARGHGRRAPRYHSPLASASACLSGARRIRRATSLEAHALRPSVSWQLQLQDRLPWHCSLVERSKFAVLAHGGVPTRKILSKLAHELAHALPYQVTFCVHATVPARRCSQFNGSTRRKAKLS